MFTFVVDGFLAFDAVQGALAERGFKGGSGFFEREIPALGEGEDLETGFTFTIPGGAGEICVLARVVRKWGCQVGKVVMGGSDKGCRSKAYCIAFLFYCQDEAKDFRGISDM